MKTRNLWAGFGAFQKVEERDDGTLTVTGICSSEDVDSDGEIVLSSAMKAAIPGFMEFGAIREMHAPSAVGTAISMEVDSAGKTWIEARICDPVAIRKIREKVYKGFSIGGRVPPGGRDPAQPHIIRSVVVSEISIVDRPSNGAARIAYAKAARHAETLLDRAISKAEGVDPSVRDLILAAMHGDTSTQGERRQDAILSTVAKSPQQAPSNWTKPEDPEPERPPDEWTDGTPHPEGAPAPDPTRCPKCEGVLSCPKCSVATVTEGAEKLAKISGLIDEMRKSAARSLLKMERAYEARDQALAKVAEARAWAGRIEKSALAKVQAAESQRDAAASERDAANRELVRRPKGALRDLSAITVEKRDDMAGGTREPEVEPDVRGMIKLAHRNPSPMAGDGGPGPLRGLR